MDQVVLQERPSGGAVDLGCSDSLAFDMGELALQFVQTLQAECIAAPANSLSAIIVRVPYVPHCCTRYPKDHEEVSACMLPGALVCCGADMPQAGEF
jgi:hypothetical protein